MISLPDFKEKQILIVKAEWGEKASLRFLNENIVFAKDGKVVNRASCHKVFAAFILGDVYVSTGVMKHARKFGIALYFLKNNFDLYARLPSEAEGNYLLRMKQYGLSAMVERDMSRLIVENKIENQIRLLEEASSPVAKEEQWKAYTLSSVRSAEDQKQLLGVEGNATSVFFPAYFREVNWRRRSPRAKEDIPNFLLDMGYTYLFNIIDALLRLHGFDTYKGIYHKLFFQRRSLACDIMEPFRCIVEKQLRKSYNLKQIDPKDFRVIKGKYVLSFDKAGKYSRIFMEMIMEHREEIFSYVRQFYRHVMAPEQNAFPYYQYQR